MVASATISGSPSCSFSNRTATNYTITLSNLNATSSGISANQQININLINITNYFSVINLTGISISIYYTQEVIDLVAISTTNIITLTPRNAYIDSVVLSNGFNKTLDTPVGYNIAVLF